MDYRIWLAAGIAFGILEIVVPGFVLIWFGVGALAAALLDGLGYHDLTLQVVVFSVVSLVLTALSRLLVRRAVRATEGDAALKTNMDVLVGKTGVVTEAADAASGAGRALVQGQDWSIRTAGGGALGTGATVRVVSYEGARLVVEAVEQ